MAFIVILDACVLYPAPLRDLLIHLTLTDLFYARWTDRIHDEWIRSLLKNRTDLNRDQLERTRALMNAHVRDALVEDYESLIDTLELPDPGDRHVLAAAIKCRADMILTFNLPDFPAAQLQKWGIQVQHPDEFIANLIDLSPILVCSAVKKCRENLKRPPRTVAEYLDTLGQQRLPSTVTKLYPYSALL